MKYLQSNVLLIALICASVLFVRTAGVHLHLCLDGQEAPTAVHWADAGVHEDDEHATGGHADRDLTLGEGIFKAPKTANDLPVAILGALLLMALLSDGMRRLSLLHPPLLHQRYTHLRPPLRGPPC